jgi:hypothetical protein
MDCWLFSPIFCQTNPNIVLLITYPITVNLTVLFLVLYRGLLILRNPNHNNKYEKTTLVTGTRTIRMITHNNNNPYNYKYHVLEKLYLSSSNWLRMAGNMDTPSSLAPS